MMSFSKVPFHQRFCKILTAKACTHRKQNNKEKLYTQQQHIWLAFTLSGEPDCEKSFSVLASNQKIHLPRIDNPAVDTGTIYLPPTDFFYIPSCWKSYAW
jgi:hypothetical protein